MKLTHADKRIEDPKEFYFENNHKMEI